MVLGCSGERHPEVAVIVNELSPVSEAIGQAYADSRGIPKANLFRLRIPVNDPLLADGQHETISRAKFEELVQQPLMAWLTERGESIEILVTTKGLPLTIDGSEWPANEFLQKSTQASVDAELALIGSDQIGSPGIASSANPWFGDPRDFRRFRQEVPGSPLRYLVARLTGYPDENPGPGVPQDVARLMKAARQTPQPDATWLVDQDPELPPMMEAANDQLLAPAAALLASMGFQVHHDNKPTFVSDIEWIQGYASWGSNDGHEAHPQTYGRIEGHLYPGRFAPRALAVDLVSTNARSFSRPKSYGQSLIGDLIAGGVGGIAGHIAEPSLPAVVRPHRMLRDYALGESAIHAYYRALPYLGWMNVYIGDPLMTLDLVPPVRQPNDQDGDGIPDTLDNCLEIPNPEQRDTDTDSIGNRCDPDLNNDGRVTTSWGASFPSLRRGDIESIALIQSRGEYSEDHDLDGNGVVDERDLSIAQLYLFLPPGPGRAGEVAR